MGQVRALPGQVVMVQHRRAAGDGRGDGVRGSEIERKGADVLGDDDVGVAQRLIQRLAVGLALAVEDQTVDADIDGPFAGNGSDGEPEFGQELLFNFLKVDQLTRDGIGVEKFGSGKDLAQALAESAFTCGDSARDSYRRHFKQS